MLPYYTRCNSVPVENLYVDDSNRGAGTHYHFKRAQIDELIQTATKMKESGAVEKKDVWLFEALKKHPVTGLDVVVVGSMEPWYEAVCLAHGARSVTTSEYNRLTYEHPFISVLTPTHLRHLTPHYFGAAIAISSLDHDGLGRYGDPLAPDGDLMSMDSLQLLLKADGLLFLSVPVGPDLLTWNMQRRYGSLRLPLLLQDWTELGRLGFEEHRLRAFASSRHRYEPLFVLANRRPLPVEPPQASAVDQTQQTVSPKLEL
jgi:hypothetical protein